MFRNILVPLDGSALAEAALPHAEALAAAFGATLRLLRVIPVRRRAGAAPLDIIDRRLGHVEADAYLNALALALRARGIPVETEVVEGQPPDRILESLRAHRHDLVVLTTHGAGGCTEYPISGTANKVVTRAGTSILMLPVSDEAAARAAPGGKYLRILIGLDGSRRGDWALAPVADFARRVGAELILAHIVHVPDVVEEPPSPELHEAVERLVTLNREAAERHLAEAQRRFGSPDLLIRTRIAVSSRVPEALADLAETERADLVVLSAHGASMSTRCPYGAVALQVLTEARRPLLIAQDAPLRAPWARTQRASARATDLHHR